ncbi:MAG: M28 family peptidase [Verrucomicrobiota bacterium]|nr:M28 family peptidase [Verrucomicrobiota bacterium]
MDTTARMMEMLVRERPVGTSGNREILAYVEKQFSEAGYAVDSLPLKCMTWEEGPSWLAIGNERLPILPGPFSPSFHGRAEGVFLHSLEELKASNLGGKLVVLLDELVQSPLQPKEYPFYYPDEHREIITALEEKPPAAILAATGRHPACGMEPFAVFADGNFRIPSAYVHAATGKALQRRGRIPMEICIDSTTQWVESRQLVAGRGAAPGVRRGVVCAHMDSAYHSPGALDNAAGLAMMLRLMERLKNGQAGAIDFVPFNTEEYFGADGELAYLNRFHNLRKEVAWILNLDSPCHAGSRMAVSTYHLEEEKVRALEASMVEDGPVVSGAPWYAGDHIPFVMQGVPGLAVASSDLAEDGLKDTHTPGDVLSTVDVPQIEMGSRFLAEFITRHLRQA